MVESNKAGAVAKSFAKAMEIAMIIARAMAIAIP